MSACIIARHRVIGRPGVGGWQAGRAAVCRRGRQGQGGRQPSGPLPPGDRIAIEDRGLSI